MSDNVERSRWLDRVIAQLSARDGVTPAQTDDGGAGFEIMGDRGRAEVTLGPAASDYKILKGQYGALRDTLAELGIEEGMSYTAPKRPRRPMTPEMLAARAKQQTEFEAWQELWRIIRQAEKALDVEFELAQMMDYY